jgi:ABC-type transport system involved in multi-copper enzyme maturation permease subunit
MLWYKAWRESRGRFVLSSLTIAVLCAVTVAFEKDAAGAYEQPPTYDAFIWQSVYKSGIRELFLLLAILLGLGGLLRERAHGTAGFTLALPVSRRRLLAARAGVGALEIAGLSLVPALVLPTLSPMFHESYPVSQALQFSLLWTVGGALFFAVGLLASTLFGGEYTAGICSVAVLLAYSLMVDVPGVEAYIGDVHDVMSGSGMPYFQPAMSRLAGPLPWWSLAAILLIAFVLTAIAAQLTKRHDF